VLKLIIEDDEGRKTVVPFVRDEITIGRQEGNTIRLTERNVSRRHARLLRQNGHVLVEDLDSYTGVRINGERIQGPAKVGDGDLIQIGDYDLALQKEAASQPMAPTVRLPAAELQAAMDELSSTSSEESAEADAPASREEDDAPPLTPAEQRRHSTAVIRMDQVEMNRSRKVENLDPEDAPHLVVVSAEFKGQEFACIRTEMRIGRTEDNDISLDHRSLSRTHAKLVREDSGEWRIIDMQSANGMAVNGESYAQSSLAHGDLLELGHVKLRFVGPGQSTEGLLHERAARGGTKKPLLLAAVGMVLLCVIGGAAWFLVGQRPATPVKPPQPAVVEKQPEQQAQPPTPEPVRKPATNPDPQPQPAAESALAQLEEKLQSAQASMEARDFDKAVATLEPLQDANGQRPAKAEELLEQARAEQDLKKNLDLAQKEFEAGRYEEARKYLQASEGTISFADEHAALTEQVDGALAPPAKPNKKPVAGTPRRSTEEQARQLYSDGVTLARKQQYAEAEYMLKKCIAVEPTYASCYKILGATVAKRSKPEDAVKHYREFLRLAPNDPSATQIRQIVADYEKQKQQGGGQ
jgi:pSer/pThr/pTyr-binding forkhead associated (FHA) protein/tetratricopeptide (TPR) repeat protein